MQNLKTYDKDSVRMVRTQIQARGINDARLIDALCRISRRHFAAGAGERAFQDRPVGIGYGQTISQPYIVALMTEMLSLSGRERVLEIGTGSGYQTAVLAELAGEVYTVERLPPLARFAEKKLRELGYSNVFFKTGDGCEGWPEHGPFDRILVTAAAPGIPEILKEQMADNAVMIVPVGNYKTFQNLCTVIRLGGHFKKTGGIGCRFVPLIGREGF